MVVFEYNFRDKKEKIDAIVSIGGSEVSVSVPLNNCHVCESFVLQFGAYFGHSVAAVDLNNDG